MGLVVLIDRAGYRLNADCKVIKRSEACVVADIAESFSLAQQHIATVTGDVESSCEALAQKGYREGFASAQRDAAQKLAAAEINRVVFLQSLQPALVDVVLDAVELLVKGLDRKAFLSQALEVLQSALRNASWARLHVHPQAAAIAGEVLAEFDRETGLGRLACVTTDETLSEDGCVLETDFGVIDASLGIQLDAIRSAIAGAARELTISIETESAA